MNTTTDRMTKALALTALLALAAPPALAGNFFEEELGTDDAKILDKVKIDNLYMGGGGDSGRGQAPYLPALGGPPKRVALVTFYVKDSGNSENHPYLGWKATSNVTANAVDVYANELYDASIASLKEGFARSGIELLTREQFLDTPEKKQAYEAYKLQFSAAGKFVNWATHLDKDSTLLEGVAEGYRILSVPTFNSVDKKDFTIATQNDGKLNQSLGDELAKTLGVDAVAVMYSIVQAQSKSIAMLGSYLYVFGPNPVKRTDDPSLYWTGHNYSGAKIKFDVDFVRTTRKGVAEDADFAGFARVANALATKTGMYLVAKTRGEK